VIAAPAQARYAASERYFYGGIGGDGSHAKDGSGRVDDSLVMPFGLRPEGMTALDTLAGELAGAHFDNVAAEGHTDRLGSTAYNPTLSQSRADAVKTRRVTTGHLDPTKITAVGKGESQPVTLPDQCQGGASAQVIACLQPDRRVVIEVAGSR